MLAIATDKALRISKSTRAPFAEQYANFFDMHSEPNEFYRGNGIGYGPMFMEWAAKWLNGEKIDGYGSYGNGSGMRVPPVAYHFDRMIDILNVAHASANCTHNHPYGTYWAQMLSLAIWAARQGASAEEVLLLMKENSEESFDYNEDRLIKHYVFDPSCQGSVPQAIWAALQGPDFHSVMVRCLKIGGDTDTICAMAGALAEPLWGLPDEMAQMTLKILERDGPFLFEEYKIAVEQNPNYPNYLCQRKPATLQKGAFLALLLNKLFKHPAS